MAPEARNRGRNEAARPLQRLPQIAGAIKAVSGVVDVQTL
jgi:hypothetical protein